MLVTKKTRKNLDQELSALSFLGFATGKHTSAFLSKMEGTYFSRMVNYL